MIINMNEIPENGKTFVINTRTGEFTASIGDLIGKNNYDSEFTIRPISDKNYELIGFIKTTLPEQCSRCGIDFQYPITSEFKEMIIPQFEEDPRNSHYSKANHFSDLNLEGPNIVEYQGNHFAMGEYIREVVALAEPFTPVAPEDEKGDCTVCKISLKNRAFDYVEEMPEEKNNAFSVLKNLKLN